MSDTAEMEVLFDGQRLDATGIDLYERGIKYLALYRVTPRGAVRLAYGHALMSVIRQLNERFPARTRTEWRNSVLFAAYEVTTPVWT